MLFASVAYLPEKIPVTLLSSGISKLLCLLLAIASNPCLIPALISTATPFRRPFRASHARHLAGMSQLGTTNTKLGI